MYSRSLPPSLARAIAGALFLSHLPALGSLLYYESLGYAGRRRGGRGGAAKPLSERSKRPRGCNFSGCVRFHSRLPSPALSLSNAPSTALFLCLLPILGSAPPSSDYCSGLELFLPAPPLSSRGARGSFFSERRFFRPLSFFSGPPLSQDPALLFSSPIFPGSVDPAGRRDPGIYIPFLSVREFFQDFV